MNPTIYQITERKNGNILARTPVIENFLKKLKHGHTYEIKRINKGPILTDWGFVMNNIGTSVIIPTWRGETLNSLLEKFEFNKIQQCLFSCLCIIIF